MQQKTTETPLSILAWPHWPDNPYQALLAQSLEQIGVQVEVAPAGSRSLRAAIKKQAPDCIHLHTLYYLFIAPTSFQAWFRALRAIFWLLTLRLRGRTLIWTVHDLQNHNNQNPRVDWFFCFCFARIAHGIILHSERIKQQFRQRFRLSTERKLYVIPHGHYIDCYPNHIQPAEARHRLTLKKDHLTFLFLGLIRPYKGLPELISSFQSLPQDSIQLAIAGKPASGDIGQQISELIKDDRNIHFWPTYIEEDQIQDYMNAADVVVFPYRRVLTSGSIILAMSFGRACIAPQQGGIEDVLDSSGAFLYDPKQAGGLAQAIQTAVMKQDLLTSMGEYNRHKVQRWDWNDIAKQTKLVYQASSRTVQRP